MVDMFNIAIAVSLMLSQVGICFAGSRCTKIKSPCFEVERELSHEEEERPKRPRRMSEDLTEAVGKLREAESPPEQF
jgi:hypothetical protein